MPTLANQQHELFCQNVVKGANNGDAYLAAGYKAKNALVASAAATRLLKDVNIKGRIAELLAEAQAKTTLSKAWVIERLMANVERAMTAEPVLDREGNPTGEYTYQGSVANRALELLGKEIAMFVDRKEVGGPGDFKDLSDEQLDAEIAALAPELQQQLRGARKATRH